MAHWIEDLEELCEKVVDEISEANRKLRADNGTLSAGDVEYLDKLTHMLKSIKTTIAMGEYEDEYSNTYGGNSYARGGNRGGSGRGSSNDGNSYARGNGRRSPRRDSMGRYSRDGYSYDDAKDDMLDELKDLMKDAPDERIKSEFKRFIGKVENM